MRLAIVAFVVFAFPVAVRAEPPTLEFAGYTWQVRDYDGGPGPNSWDPANAFVAADGLHLRISEQDGTWRAAEVIMTAPLGFGTYSFTLAGRPDRLDKNVVLGLFSYPGSPEVGPDGTNEIDIEFAQWGNAKTTSRLHWTVHGPVEGAAVAQQSHTAKIGDAGSVQSFHWTAKGVTYGWVKGTDGAAKPASSWSYAPKSATKHVPQQPLVIHMNLWLYGGEPPGDGQPAEVVISNFTFVPD